MCSLFDCKSSIEYFLQICYEMVTTEKKQILD